jgi:uncharacterized RmlC-like cupin family protein
MISDLAWLEGKVTDRIRIVPHDGLEPGPATVGMHRKSALANEGLWLGEVRTEPGAVSEWHHHGEHTTYGYVVAGTLHFDFGPNGAESLEAKSGDFFMVPPHVVHREGNPNTEEQVLVGIRIGTGPSVVNVEGPDSSK